jgi:multidrug efflux pump subunit AcrA (membrane-fusion protein)
MWAAQRALDMAKYDLERLRRQAGDSADLEAEIDAASEARDAARAALEDAQAQLTARRDAELPDNPAGEARAIRAQIETVERSLREAEAAREADVANLAQDVEAARREIDSATRQTERAIERFELDAPDADVEAALAELRNRREQLTADDPGLSAIGRVLRDLALEAPEPLLVFIEPDPEPDEDLIGALISVSGLKRTVVVTDKTEMLAEVREMEPALGAVREPLETSGVNRQELARSDGNRT